MVGERWIVVTIQFGREGERGGGEEWKKETEYKLINNEIKREI